MNHVFEEIAANFRLEFSSCLHNILHFNRTFLQNSAEVQLSSDLMSRLNLHLDKTESWRADGSLYCGKKQCQSRAGERSKEHSVLRLCSYKVTLDCHSEKAQSDVSRLIVTFTVSIKSLKVTINNKTMRIINPYNLSCYRNEK